ncbi:MAG: radical SAM family heme chaperone HemW [Verrucomicrobiota bacterium]|nr:radical SAM family heme chaperone HemW [Verrucomicrobiota bacterium]
MKTRESEHLYVHVPFCDGKCVYCAFYSEAYTADRAEGYLNALSREFDLYLASNPRPAPRTVYLGGGTSSILETSQLDRLCRIVSERISRANLKEWTLEANPGTLPEAKLRVLLQHGVNRISIGAQSFDDDVLDRIGRRHAAAAIELTVLAARAAGIGNIGLDLIACLPGIRDDTWAATLEKAVRLEPSHISIYALTVEKGTPMSRLVRSGDVIVPDDDLQVQTLDLAEKLLGQAGYERYEISNYARPGCRCAHNVACWDGKDYLGLGPAASSRSGLRRWTNKPNLDRYVRALDVGEELPREEDTLSADTDATERLIFRFRLADTVDLSEFGGTSAQLLNHWERTLGELEKNGLVRGGDGRWALTRQGRNFADFVAYELINV